MYFTRQDKSKIMFLSNTRFSVVNYDLKIRIFRLYPNPYNETHFNNIIYTILFVLHIF